MKGFPKVRITNRRDSVVIAEYHQPFSNSLERHFGPRCQAAWGPKQVYTHTLESVLSHMRFKMKAGDLA